MEKQFIRVVFVVVYVIFCENNSQLASRGMVAYSFEISDGDSTRKSATTIAHEYLTTKYMKVENSSTYSPVVQGSSLLINNDGLQEKGANETDDKDYSGDVGVEYNVSPTVSMEREVTMNPLTANAQYFADGKEADSSADSEDETTLKPSKNSEISDLYSEVEADFEFSGNSQLETSDDVEQSDDLLKELGFEISGSGSSGEEGFYFTTDLEGFSTTVDLDARSTEEEYPSLKVTVEEVKVSTSKYSSHSVVLNVKTTSYISAIPKADNYNRNPFLKSGHSSLIPTKLFGGIRRRTRPTVSGVGRINPNGKVTAEFLSMASAVNNRRHYNRPDKYEASKVPSNMASTISMEIDPEGILLGKNESMFYATPDNSLQKWLFQIVDETRQKNLGLSNISEGRTATDFKKSSTSLSSEHSRLYEDMDDEKSRAVFISTSPPKVQTSTEDYVLQNGEELPLNSTANEQSAEFDPSEKALMICSAIFIPLVIIVVIIITVICIRGNHHKKICCTKTGTNVEESKCEDPSFQLSEVINPSRTDPPPLEHLGIAQEA